jgi:hypothetical protein
MLFAELKLTGVRVHEEIAPTNQRFHHEDSFIEDEFCTAFSSDVQ